LHDQRFTIDPTNSIWVMDGEDETMFGAMLDPTGGEVAFVATSRGSYHVLTLDRMSNFQFFVVFLDADDPDVIRDDPLEQGLLQVSAITGGRETFESKGDRTSPTPDCCPANDRR
jgi:hypothetical protein